MSEERPMARARGNGCLFRQAGTSIWWVQFRQHGLRFRESPEAENGHKADADLWDKLAETSLRTYSPRASQVTVAESAGTKPVSGRNNGGESVHSTVLVRRDGKR